MTTPRRRNFVANAFFYFNSDSFSFYFFKIASHRYSESNEDGDPELPEGSDSLETSSSLCLLAFFLSYYSYYSYNFLNKFYANSSRDLSSLTIMDRSPWGKRWLVTSWLLLGSVISNLVNPRFLWCRWPNYAFYVEPPSSYSLFIFCIPTLETTWNLLDLLQLFNDMLYWFPTKNKFFKFWFELPHQNEILSRGIDDFLSLLNIRFYTFFQLISFSSCFDGLTLWFLKQF